MKLKQGDIVWVSLSPTYGHEQHGMRPAIILQDTSVFVAGNTTLVAPITSKIKSYPLQVDLDNRTQTQGTILCTQARALDLDARQAIFKEHAPDDITQQCCEIVQLLLQFNI